MDAVHREAGLLVGEVGAVLRVDGEGHLGQRAGAEAERFGAEGERAVAEAERFGGCEAPCPSNSTTCPSIPDVVFRVFSAVL